MKKIFYLFIFVFLTVSVYAQKSIRYVSFFPVSVTQNNVVLTQDKNSFSLLNGSTGYGVSNHYHEYQGGLILGAADGAHINVNNLSIKGSTAIDGIKVDSAIKISARGGIETLILGDKEYCSDCKNVFISAPLTNITWSAFKSPSNNLSPYEMDINVKKETALQGILLRQTNGTYKEFLPGLNSSIHGLTWVRLRIKGDNTCRKYLVRYLLTDGIPEDKCNDPTGPVYAAVQH